MMTHCLIRLAVLKSDIPRFQTNPSLSGLVLFQERSWLYGSASVAAITLTFEDLADLRVSDIRDLSTVYTFNKPMEARTR
jgi:hypothetical protein